MYGEELGLKSSLIKTKGLSISSAQANAAGLTKEMFQRIDAMYEEHWNAKILKTLRPTTDQIWNGDE
eukprot:1194512-Rhodomonas_salina.1